LETLTNNLLILSRIETHSLPDERHKVDLVKLVRETSELYASQAEQMGITFMIDAPLEPTIVTANEAQLRRTLCNLRDKAISSPPKMAVWNWVYGKTQRTSNYG